MLLTARECSQAVRQRTFNPKSVGSIPTTPTTMSTTAMTLAVSTLYRKHLIVDPDAEEEQLADATVTVTMDGATVVGVHKPGGTAEASETDLMHCVAACRLNLEARAKAIDAAFA